jgi:hypothetical protein
MDAQNVRVIIRLLSRIADALEEANRLNPVRMIDEAIKAQGEGPPNQGPLSRIEVRGSPLPPGEEWRIR